MYLFLGCVVIVVALLALEVLTAGRFPSVIPNTINLVERACLPRFGWVWIPLLAAGFGYAILTPIGLGKEFATFSGIIFFTCLFKCWTSFGSDVVSIVDSAATGRVRANSWQASPFFTVMTVFGACGSLIGALSFNWAA